MKAVLKVWIGIAALVCLLQEALGIELATEIKDAFGYKEDTFVYKMATYFKGNNKSLTFTTAEEAIQVVNPFLFQNLKIAVGHACTIMRSSNKGSLDLVFGLCNEGKTVIKVTFDPFTFSKESEHVLYQTDQGVTCNEMKLSPLGDHLLLACTQKSGESNSALLLDLNPATLEKIGTTEIPLYGKETSINQPVFDFDLNATDSMAIMLYDTKKNDENLTLRYIKWQNGVAAIGPIFSDYAEDEDLLDGKLKLANIKAIQIRGNRYVFFIKTDTTKMTSCKTTVDKIECSPLLEVFQNLDDEYQVEFESFGSNRTLAAHYISSKKYLRRRLSFDGLKDVSPVQALYFEIPLQVDADTKIAVSDNDILISSKRQKDKTPILVYWRVDRSYVTLNTTFSASFGGIFSRLSPTDKKSLEILYFDTARKEFDLFWVTSPKFKIKGSSEVFLEQNPATFHFAVSDAFEERKYTFSIKVLHDIFDQYFLGTSPKFEMFAGDSGVIPLSTDALQGNSPLFSASSSSDKVNIDIKYAGKLAVNTPIFEGSEARIQDLKSIGQDRFMFVNDNGTVYILGCTPGWKADKLDCYLVFSLQAKGERIIDAKFDLSQYHFLSAVGQGASSKIKLRQVEYDGSDSSDPVEFNINSEGSLGAIRIVDHTVFIDVLGRNHGSVEWRLFSLSFKESAAIPAAFAPSTALPSHVCPKALMWSPRKEPFIFLESICEGKDRQILEFEVDYTHPDNIKLFKVWPVSTKKDTGICVTGPMLVLVEFETGVIFSINRGISSDSRSTYPLKELGFIRAHQLTCSRYNNFFQVVASKADGSFAVITYRSDAVTAPTRRIHSVVPLASRDPQFSSASLNSQIDQVFTLVVNDKLESIEAVYTYLDIPTVSLDAKQLATPSNFSVTFKTKPSLGQNPKETEFTFQVALKTFSNDILFKRRNESTPKIQFPTHSNLLNLDQHFIIGGLEASVSVDLGDLKSLAGKVRLTQRYSYRPDSFELKSVFHGVRMLDDFTFTWNETSIMIFEKGKLIHHFPGIYILTAEPDKGTIKHDNGTVEEFAYLLGLSKMRTTHNEKIFVIKRDHNGKWWYAEKFANEGTVYAEVFLIDPKVPTFTYMSTNTQTDSVEAGRLKMEWLPNEEHFTLIEQKHQVLKRVEMKIDHAQAMMINGSLKIIYNARNTPDLHCISINPRSLEIEGETIIDFGRGIYESYTNNYFRCSEYHDSNKTIEYSEVDEDMQVYCAFSTRSHSTRGTMLTFSVDPKRTPKVVQNSSVPNIQGFSPIRVRTHLGYTALVHRAITGFNTDLVPAELRNETILLQIIKNGENNTHALIPLSKVGFSHVNSQLLGSARYAIDFSHIGGVGGKIRAVLSTNVIDETLREFEVSPITLELDDKKLDLSKIKIKVQSLSLQKEIVLDTIVENHGSSGNSNLGRIMLILTGALVLMLILAGVYYCCQRSKAASNLDEPEVPINGPEDPDLSGEYSRL